MKKAIVLGGTGAHVPLLKKLKERNYYTLLVDYLEKPIAVSFANEHHQISTLDQEAVLALAKKENIDLIICACVDQAIITACFVAEKLNLPIPYSYETAKVVSNKWQMKKKLQLAGIKTPSSISFTVKEIDNTNNITYPCIVKPVDNCGSKGVKVVYNQKELKSATKNALHASPSKTILIEAFHSGREIVLDAHIQKNVAQIIDIYEKFNIYSPNTVIQCFRSIRPINITENLFLEATTIVQKIADAFNFENTPLFVQTILNDNGFHVIEFGARSAGGLAAKATLIHTGYDAVEAVICSYLGETMTTLSIKPTPGYISTNSIYAQPGILNYVSGYDQLLAENIIREFTTYKAQGMPILSDLSSSDRIAGFIVTANTHTEVIEKTNIALNQLAIWNHDGQDIMLRNLFEKSHLSHIEIN
jgi:carbamoylphosphate synthase large subunit